MIETLLTSGSPELAPIAWSGMVSLVSRDFVPLEPLISTLSDILAMVRCVSDVWKLDQRNE